MSTDLLAALALMVALEGLAIAIFAGRFAELATRLAALPEHSVRRAGVAGVVLGVLSYILLRGAL